MKKFKNLPITLYMSVLVVILLALNVFQSCKKEPAQLPPAPLSLLEQMVATYNAGKPEGMPSRASLMQGTMTAMTLPSKEALFFLQENGSGNTHLFLCQGETLSADLLEELGQVRVAYLHESVVIETADKGYYTFSIGERKGHDLAQQVTGKWTGLGYGLALNSDTDLRPEMFKGKGSFGEVRANSCKCRAVTQDDSDCNSGGSGSTDCSIGSTEKQPGCSVSCSNGNYACCKNI
jgi:hypothetical protein